MAIKDWSTDPGQNVNAPPFGAPEGWAPSTANDVVRQVMADVRAQFEQGGWFDYGHDLTRLAGNQFAAAGNHLSIYSLDRKVRVSGTNTGTHYGAVTESTFNGASTIVTVQLLSGSIQVDTNFAVAVGVDSNILPQVSGPIIRLIASGQTFSYDNSSGTPALIGPTDITFTINRYNSSSDVTWTVFNEAGAEVTPLTSTSNTGATLTAAAFGALDQNFIRVRASADGVFDEVTIVRLLSGIDGEASTFSITGFITNEAHSVPAAVDGSSPILTGAEGEFKVFEGLTDVTASATFSIVSVTGGITVNINTDTNTPIDGQPRGFYRVTGMTSDNATARFRAVYGGVTLERIFSLSKSKQGAAGVDASLYYIQPTTGTALKNSTGQLTIQARRALGTSDTLLSSGTIRLFDPDNNIVNEANGYAAGSDGYTGVFSAADIDGSIVITLKDGAGGTPLDTITLIDVTDGLASTIGSVNAERGLVWRRGPDNNWTPSQTTNAVTARFFREGVQVSERIVTVTLNPGDGTLTAAATSNSGEATTFSTSGSGTSALSITFAHTASGATAQETIATILSGAAGAPGVDGSDGSDGVDGSGVLLVFQRSSTEPATPASSPGVPVGWYSTTTAVPAGETPMWVSVGTRPDFTSNWTWQTPVRFQTIDGEPGDPGYEIVTSLPEEGNFIGRVVFWTSTEKLYRFTSTGWTAAVPAPDITGQLTASQLAANSVTADKIEAGAVTAAKLSVTELAAITANTGTLTANLIRTAASGQRLEISSTGTFPLWFGTGDKTAENGKFSVDTSGNVRVQGELIADNLDIPVAVRNLAGNEINTRPITFRSREWDPGNSYTGTEANPYYIPVTDSPLALNWASISGPLSVATNPLGVVAYQTPIFVEFMIETSSGAGGVQTLQLRYSYDSGAALVAFSLPIQTTLRLPRTRSVILIPRAAPWSTLRIRFSLIRGSTTATLNYFQAKTEILNSNPVLASDGPINLT